MPVEAEAYLPAKGVRNCSWIQTEVGMGKTVCACIVSFGLTDALR